MADRAERCSHCEATLSAGWHLPGCPLRTQRRAQGTQAAEQTAKKRPTVKPRYKLIGFNRRTEFSCSTYRRDFDTGEVWIGTPAGLFRLLKV